MKITRSISGRQQRRGWLFRRRPPTRVERLRRLTEEGARALTSAAPDLGRLTTTARHALAERAAAVEPPEFLSERLRLDRVARVGTPASLRRLNDPRMPVWMILAAAAAGAAIGVGIGLSLSERRERQQRVTQRLESAADEIKAAWPNVTDADIQEARGSIDRLVSTIGSHTGEDSGAVRERLEGITKTED